MTTTTAAPMTLETVIADFLAQAGHIATEIALTETDADRQAAYVVRSSEGLYLMHVKAGEYAPRGVRFATRYFARQARQLAGKVQNGHGDRAEAVSYAQALDTEAARLGAMIRDLRDLQAKQAK